MFEIKANKSTTQKYTLILEILCPYLSERFAEFSQNALLIKHLSLVSVLVIVVDFLTEVSRQLVEGHVLLHLLVLR